ncbi:hypothetical protein Hanom_Chr15g01402131 [Helianthus anomalus]
MTFQSICRLLVDGIRKNHGFQKIKIDQFRFFFFLHFSNNTTIDILNHFQVQYQKLVK